MRPCTALTSAWRCKSWGRCWCSTLAAESKLAESKLAESRAAESSAADANADKRNDPSGAGPGPRTTLRVTRWEITAGGGGWLTDNTALRPGFEATAALFVSERLRIGLQFALSTYDTTTIPSESVGVDRGHLITQPFLGALNLAYCHDELTGAHLRLCGGLVGGVHFESGTTDGAFVFGKQASWIPRPAFGLEAELGWLPVRAFVVSLSLVGLVLPTQLKGSGFVGTWEVKALATKSLPLFEGLLRLSIGFGANR